MILPAPVSTIFVWGVNVMVAETGVDAAPFEERMMDVKTIVPAFDLVEQASNIIATAKIENLRMVTT
jgi:hypothetical protein